MDKNFQYKKQQITSLAKHLGIISFILIVLLPIFAIVSISLNPIGTLGASLIPKTLSLNHWYYVLGIPQK